MSLEETRRAFESQQLSKPDFIDRMHAQHSALFDYAAWLPKTDIARIEISDGLVVMQSRRDGVRIACDPDDKRIAPIEILNFFDYERTDSDLIDRLVKDGDGILDIGANIGWYSIRLAKRLPSSRILAFEPIPRTHAQLKRNAALNGVANVQIFGHGFSDRAQTLTFYYYPTGSGNASSAKLVDVAGVQEVQCQVLPLDDFLGQHPAKVDFIKCDVEGAELLVFKGAVKTLAQHQPIVFSEMLRKWSARFNYHPNEIIGLFKGLGYRCFAAQGDGLAEFQAITDDTIETNFFFLHGAKHAAQIASLTVPL